jgi:putative transcriptional regulator
MKPHLLRRVVGLLEGSGFIVSDCNGARSCFDVLARKGGVLILVKVLSNIESVTKNTVHELKKVSYLTGGVPLVVGERLKSSKLMDGAVYERYGVSALNLSTMENLVHDSMPVAHSIRGNYCAKINPGMLRSLRNVMDLTQEKLALELGVSKQSVYRYESSGSVPFDIMERMLKIFEDDKRLLLHEDVFDVQVQREDSSFNMRVPDTRRLVADKLENIGFSTSIINAPFDVVAREHETVYTVVSDDNRRLERKISLVNEIAKVVGGYGLCVTRRHVGRKGVAVLKPEELDEFASPGELIDRIAD